TFLAHGHSDMYGQGRFTRAAFLREESEGAHKGSSKIRMRACANARMRECTHECMRGMLLRGLLFRQAFSCNGLLVYTFGDTVKRHYLFDGETFHIPSFLVVTPCALHNGLDIAACSPHRISSTDET